MPSRSRGASLQALLIVGILLPGCLVPHWSSAQGNDVPACVLPNPDPAFVERVRRTIEEQPAPATPFPDGVSGEAHSMPFPPPPGEPLDEGTTFELLLFLDQFSACASTGPPGPLLGVLTEAKWVREFGGFPGDLDDIIEAMESTGATPTPTVIQRLELLEAWRLPDGRVVAVVHWISDPPDPEFSFDIDTLILVRHDGRWLIDDNWFGQGCRFVAPEDCPYGPPDGTPFVTPSPFS